MQFKGRRHQSAFTLIELMILLAVIGLMAAIAMPNYQQYIERTKRSQAIKDIAVLSMAIEHFHSDHQTYPANLAALGGNLPTADPWGHAYRYLAIDTVPSPNTGQIRRDRNMNPLNSDYDLYSMGPDGQTQMQLTAARAQDDIVRAGNGGFIGLASEH